MSLQRLVKACYWEFANLRYIDMRIVGVDSDTVLIPGYVWGWTRIKSLTHFIVAALDNNFSCPTIFIAMNRHSVKLPSLHKYFLVNAIKNIRLSILANTILKLSLGNSFSCFTLSFTAWSCPNTSRFIKYGILTVKNEYKNVCEELLLSFWISEKAKQKIFLSIPILHSAVSTSECSSNILRNMLSFRFLDIAISRHIVGRTFCHGVNAQDFILFCH